MILVDLEQALTLAAQVRTPPTSLSAYGYASWAADSEPACTSNGIGHLARPPLPG